MADHADPLSKPPRRLFIEGLESPQHALCKELPLPPIITTLAVGEECYKGA